jgi:NADPH2:quinone reductase
MQALLCEAYGPPEQLAIRHVPDPQPGPGQLRLRVGVAGVNFPDGLIIQNRYQVNPRCPSAPAARWQA